MKRSNEPDQRAVDHVRDVLGVVGARRSGRSKRCGMLAVELDRAHLPGPAERVVHVEVDLRPVERAVALVERVLEPSPLERCAESALGEVPLLVAAEPVLRPGRQLEARLELEQVVDELRVVEAAEDLVLDLLAGAEDVRVVLGDVPHAGAARAACPPARCGAAAPPRRSAAAARGSCAAGPRTGACAPGSSSA